MAIPNRNRIFVNDGDDDDNQPMNSNFRKIDVDVYDEDVLLETELYDPDPRGPQQVIADAKAKATAVRTSLAK